MRHANNHVVLLGQECNEQTKTAAFAPEYLYRKSVTVISRYTKEYLQYREGHFRARLLVIELGMARG